MSEEEAKEKAIAIKTETEIANIFFIQSPVNSMKNFP